MLHRVPIELCSVLDPRSKEEAVRNPIMHAVNIPFDDLAVRTHELPSGVQTLQVADFGPISADAVAWLTERGRAAVLCRPAPGPSCASGRLWSPNAFLEQIAGSLPPGQALDLGCGTGRDAVFLASLGWRVEAVDVLPDAIERGRALACRYPDLADRISWRVLNLDQASPPTGPVDLVTSLFFLSRPALAAAAANLNPGGSLVLETFTPRHRETFGKPHSPGLVLGAEEASHLFPHMSIRRLGADWHENGRHTLRAWWQAPG